MLVRRRVQEKRQVRKIRRKVRRESGRPRVEKAWGRVRTPAPKRDLKKFIWGGMEGVR